MKSAFRNTYHATLVVLIGFAAFGVAAAATQLFHWLTPPVQPRYLSATEAERSTRRIEVTLQDVQVTWGRIFRSEGRKFAPVEHRFFVRRKTSPCGNGEDATGPFYCAKDRTLNFDLAFFAAITPQLREVEDPASKLIVAQIAAVAVQDQLGVLARTEPRNGDRADHEKRTMALALQADCLTGIWAADAKERLGSVPERRYAVAIQGMRRIAEAREESREEPAQVLNSLALGTTKEREEAFFVGYDSGKLETCLRLSPASDKTRSRARPEP